MKTIDKLIKNTKVGAALAVGLAASPYAQAVPMTLGWNDNANNETAVIIKSSLDGKSYHTLATLPANTTSYRIEQAPNTRVFYEVFAQNAKGTSGGSGSLGVQTSNAGLKIIADLTRVKSSGVTTNVLQEQGATYLMGNKGLHELTVPISQATSWQNPLYIARGVVQGTALSNAQAVDVMAKDGQGRTALYAPFARNIDADGKFVFVLDPKSYHTKATGFNEKDIRELKLQVETQSALGSPATSQPKFALHSLEAIDGIVLNKYLSSVTNGRIVHEEEFDSSQNIMTQSQVISRAINPTLRAVRMSGTLPAGFNPSRYIGFYNFDSASQQSRVSSIDFNTTRYTKDSIDALTQDGLLALESPASSTNRVFKLDLGFAAYLSRLEKNEGNFTIIGQTNY
jgi:hypothetical protein